MMKHTENLDSSAWCNMEGHNETDMHCLFFIFTFTKEKYSEIGPIYCYIV